MPIAICSKCHLPCPDSFHDFEKYCTCLSKEEWIEHYRKNKWMLTIDGKEYNFNKKKKQRTENE